MSQRRLVFAITGASGAPYALRLLSHLKRLKVGVDLLVSSAGDEVLRREVDHTKSWTEDGKAVLDAFELSDADARTFGTRDFGAPAASGTGLVGGMVICPCSMGTVGRLASGVSASLIERAADVCLKERRPLVLVCRETPLSLIHLQNMTRLAEAGAIILPAAPGFYHRPKTMEDLVDHLCAKILDSLRLDQDIVQPWGDES